MNWTFGWSASRLIGTAASAIFLEIMNVERRMPNALSWQPACQMEILSAFHVSFGPTVAACVGTSAILPPPDVRAFYMTVIRCTSTIRVVS